jgi:histidine triad (HIT) family protein
VPDTIFDRIVRGEAPAHRLWEDEAYLAFLDIHPSQSGHTLLIPKRAGGDVFDLAPGVYAGLWDRARRLSGPLREATGAARIGVVVEGFQVDHAHVHLIPLHRIGDLRPPPEEAAPDAELAATAARIRAAVEAAGL